MPIERLDSSFVVAWLLSPHELLFGKLLVIAAGPLCRAAARDTSYLPGASASKQTPEPGHDSEPPPGLLSAFTPALIQDDGARMIRLDRTGMKIDFRERVWHSIHPCQAPTVVCGKVRDKRGS